MSGVANPDLKKGSEALCSAQLPEMVGVHNCSCDFLEGLR